MARAGLTMRALACALLSPLPPLLLAASLLQAPETMNDSRYDSVLTATLVADQSGARSSDTHADVAQQKMQAQRMTADARTSIAAHDPVPAPEVDLIAEAGPVADDGAAYIPAAQLTERPQALQEIAPDWDAPGAVPPRISGTLLISEYGDVDRLLLDDRELTRMQRQLLRDRFRLARFVPGKLYGRPVCAALRIEIRFD